MIRTGKGPSKGSTRLTILLATVVAFTLVPAAQALANGSMILTVEGTGNGTVDSTGGYEGGFYKGSPPLECSYEAPGPQTGTCTNTLANEGEGIEGVYMDATAGPGSKLVAWLIEEGEIGIGCKESGNPALPSCLPYVLEGEGNVVVTAIFECTEAGEAEELCGEEETPEFPLTVTKEGSGEGTVTSSPAGIECGSECEAQFEEGTEVTLTASPESGSEFTGWSGAGCSGTGTCEVTMEEEEEVTATFEEEPTPEYELEIETDGSGSGEVECKVDGGSAEACELEYEEGTEVALVPVADPGSEFVKWSGDCTGSGACTLTMTEDKEVTATFDEEPAPEFELEIGTNGTGSGEVECEVEGGEAEACEAEYEEGTEVALVPVPDPGSEFVKWSGDCTGSGACELEMDEDKSVTATFDDEAAPEFDLTIVKAGTGSGTVTCNGGACASTYEEGEEITLAASAASGSTFAGWSGGGCSGTGSCKVTITADTTVTATFTANPAPPTPTCQTDPSLCPPPPPVEGKARAAASAQVKSGKASLKLTCTGGPCKGTIQLKATVKQGKKTKSLVIGKASFSIAEGTTATIKVKLSGPAKQELAKGKTLKAKTSGAGVTASTVKIKPPKKA